MVYVNKKINDYGYNSFDIITDEGKFSISFYENFDLYWNYYCSLSESKTLDKKEFFITKENYFLYSLFDDLYESIINGVIVNEDFDNLFDEKLDDRFYDELYPYYLFNDEDNYRISDRTYVYKDEDRYNEYSLLKNGIIDWHSDDFFYDIASRVMIEKENDSYKVTFCKSKDQDLIFNSFSVRFSNSGSRYKDFNALFMQMYHKLGEYDSDNHQIHIEEYLSKTKKLSR